MSTTVYQAKPGVEYSAIAHQPKASTRPRITPGHGSQRSSGRARPPSASARPIASGGPSAASGSLASAARPKTASPAIMRARLDSTSAVSASAKPTASVASSSVSGRT